MPQSNFLIGQIVKYSNPVNDKEKEARFTILEIHPPDTSYGDNLPEKLTVEFMCDMYFKPVNTYFSYEFTSA